MVEPGTKISPVALIAAARAEHIPEGGSGLWYIQKGKVEEGRYAERHGKIVYVMPGTITHLFRITESTLYKNPPGEVVMEDTHHELKTHLNFMMKARGRVLVTGLGLGCVVRGLLANPAVEHVTCIEMSPDVLKLVQPYMPKDRLTIIEADALEWTVKTDEQFDCAWHDLWTDRDSGQPHLDAWHMRLLFQCRKHVRGIQGAWSFDRAFRTKLRDKGLNLI